jgi:predicted transcriptional regulator
MYIDMEKKVKRTFSKLRENILITLAEDKKTINEISRKADINWRTVESHLNYLSGRGLVNEAFSSDYVRIFEITPEGEEYIKKVKDSWEENCFQRRLTKEVKVNAFGDFT